MGDARGWLVVRSLLLALAWLVPAVAHAQTGALSVPDGYGAPAPYVAPEPPPPGATVRFRTEGPEPLRVYVRRGEGWEPLCRTPCTRRLGLGDHTLAIAPREHEPAALRHRAHVAGDVTLRLRYEDGAGDRGAGVGLIFGGLVVAGGLGGGMIAATIGLLGGGGLSALGAIGTIIASVVGFAGGLAMLVVGIVMTARQPHGEATEEP